MKAIAKNKNIFNLLNKDLQNDVNISSKIFSDNKNNTDEKNIDKNNTFMGKLNQKNFESKNKKNYNINELYNCLTKCKNIQYKRLNELKRLNKNSLKINLFEINL